MADPMIPEALGSFEATRGRIENSKLKIENSPFRPQTIRAGGREPATCNQPRFGSGEIEGVRTAKARSPQRKR
jgi:hypothetical protein